ncbi:MAG: hypothetical protein LIO46_01410 [Clostridiales bacterium]|nr:hypothetical protein [Clostridiales bacterium]
MYNVLKMDLYRMFRQKSTWILIAVMASLSILVVCIEYWEANWTDQDPAYSDSQLEDMQDGDDWFYGFELESNDEAFDASELSGTINLFLGIFTVLLAGSEITTGYRKNIAGQVRRRSALILPRLVPIALFTLMSMFALVIPTLLGRHLLLGNVTGAELLDRLSVLPYQLLMHTAFGACILAVISLLRSTAAYMVSVVLLALEMQQLIYSVMNFLLNRVPALSEFSVVPYTLTGAMAELSTSMGTGQIVRTLAVSAAFLAGGTAIACWRTARRDIA